MTTTRVGATAQIKIFQNKLIQVFLQTYPYTMWGKVVHLKMVGKGLEGLASSVQKLFFQIKDYIVCWNVPLCTFTLKNHYLQRILHLRFNILQIQLPICIYVHTTCGTPFHVFSIIRVRKILQFRDCIYSSNKMIFTLNSWILRILFPHFTLYKVKIGSIMK